MAFQYPQNSIYYVLVFLVMLVDIIVSLVRKQRITSVATGEIWRVLVPEFSLPRKIFKRILIYTALLIFPLAIMEPQWGNTTVKRLTKNSDVVFLVDISLSMLTEDTTPNRLERAKIEVEKLVQKMQGERVALIAFTGVAGVILPLGEDYLAFTRMLKSLTPNTLSRQGTNLKLALLSAKKVFDNGRLENNKTIILVSDGETHTAETDAAAIELKNSGIVVHTLGIGSSQGGKIPIENFSNGEKTFLSSGGVEVVSKFENEALNAVAEITGGLSLHVEKNRYFHEQLQNRLTDKRSISVGMEEVEVKISRFSIPLAIILFLLVIETATTNRSRKILMLLAFFSLPIIPDQLDAQIRIPNPFDRSAVKVAKTMELKQFAKAAEEYKKIVAEEGASIELLNNLALAQIQAASQQQKASDSISNFNQAASILKLKGNSDLQTTEKLSEIYYNLGVALYQTQNYSEAASVFAQSLRYRPGNEKTRYNLELSLKQSNRPPEKKQQNEEKQEKAGAEKNQSSSVSSESTPQKGNKELEDQANENSGEDENNNTKNPISQPGSSTSTRKKIDRRRAEQILEKIEENLSQQRKISIPLQFSGSDNTRKSW